MLVSVVPEMPPEKSRARDFVPSALCDTVRVYVITTVLLLYDISAYTVLLPCTPPMDI